jgi:hypothetical protein
LIPGQTSPDYPIPSSLMISSTKSWLSSKSTLREERALLISRPQSAKTKEQEISVIKLNYGLIFPKAGPFIPKSNLPTTSSFSLIMESLRTGDANGIYTLA